MADSMMMGNGESDDAAVDQAVQGKIGDALDSLGAAIEQQQSDPGMMSGDPNDAAVMQGLMDSHARLSDAQRAQATDMGMPPPEAQD